MFAYGQKLLHVKRLEKYERIADQLTNLGFGGVSSSCPTTGKDGEYWVHNCKNHFSLSMCMQINHYYACLSCVVSRFVNLLKMT